MTEQIIVLDLVTYGGKIDITANILNTGKDTGRIEALAGYSNITIENHSKYDVVVRKLNNANRGAGEVNLYDLSYSDDDVKYLKTTFKSTKNAAGLDAVSKTVSTIYKDPNKAANPGADIPVQVGRNAIYQPKDGWRYAYTVTETSKVTESVTKGTSSWAGIDALARDPASLTGFKVESNNDTRMLPEGTYYYLDASDNTSYAHYGSSTNPDGAQNDPAKIAKTWETSTWYGKKTYWTLWKKEYGQTTTAKASIEADRPIQVSFYGSDKGDISIVSTGTGRVLLEGNIVNASGKVTIDAKGSIEQTRDTVTISAATVTLTSQSGSIGTGTAAFGSDKNAGAVATAGSRALRVEGTYTTDDKGNRTYTAPVVLTASAAGSVYIENVGGTDLQIDSVRSRDDDVALVSAPGIVVAKDKAGTISGGVITLSAKSGHVGSGDVTGNAILNLNAGQRQRDRVDIVAGGNVSVRQTSGDLRLNSLTAGGDVVVEVRGGSLLNVNNVVVRDERKAADLIGGVWKDLALTADDANRKFKETLSAFESSRQRDYNAYWSYRNQQANPAVYDANFEVKLNAKTGELQYYVDLYGKEATGKGLTGSALTTYVSKAVATIEQSRTAQYHALHLQYGGYGNVYHADLAGDYATYWAIRGRRADSTRAPPSRRRPPHWPRSRRRPMRRRSPAMR
ncbi:hypothetical protein GCM10025880_54260 [Methylorubrum aminovorans]|uniref:hypothetical protein n=1 Tax=Methylorubrum aminovorans TaxID=269069 RepID=UPI0023E97413|nr:hypothetical protein [Methylorubrum aminovorans]GMA79009.1 hypothetical protein GCM10025880_54260 [Methylorubrum aminovorans]